MRQRQKQSTHAEQKRHGLHSSHPGTTAPSKAGAPLPPPPPLSARCWPKHRCCCGPTGREQGAAEVPRAANKPSGGTLGKRAREAKEPCLVCAWLGDDLCTIMSSKMEERQTIDVRNNRRPVYSEINLLVFSRTYSQASMCRITSLVLSLDCSRD